MGYREALHLGELSLSRYPDPHEVNQAGAEALRLALAHGCSRWQVHLRHVDDLMRPHVRRGLMDAFIRAGTHLSPTAPLRVAVTAPQVSLPEWRARLPKDLAWDAFEWHEVPNVPAAQAWLIQLR